LLTPYWTDSSSIHTHGRLLWRIGKEKKTKGRESPPVWMFCIKSNKQKLIRAGTFLQTPSSLSTLQSLFARSFWTTFEILTFLKVLNLKWREVSLAGIYSSTQNKQSSYIWLLPEQSVDFMVLLLSSRYVPDLKEKIRSNCY
jgi:hypothetical protein